MSHDKKRTVQTILKCRAVHSQDLLLLIVKCPFNKIKILWWPTKALEKSFWLIYSNSHLNSRETVPLIAEMIRIHPLFLIILNAQAVFRCLKRTVVRDLLVSSFTDQFLNNTLQKKIILLSEIFLIRAKSALGKAYLFVSLQ